MNEIRMYVEHLFEGKLLTADMIELKEEIYGNLVARYEDLIAEGVEPGDALARTKESMTSIDDVLAGEDAEENASELSPADKDTGSGVDASGAQPVVAAPAGKPTGESLASESAAETARLEASGISAPEPQDATAAAPAVAAASAASAASGAPVSPEGAENPLPRPAAQPAQDAGKKRRTWIIVAAVVAAIVLVPALLFGAGMIGFTSMSGADVDIDEDRVEVDDGKGNEVTIDPQQGITVTDGDNEVTIGSDGIVRIDGDPADDLLTAVVNARSGDVKELVNTDPADAAAVERVLRALPMSQWLRDLDVTRGVDILSFAYREVPDTYEGESVDIALAYNVAAIFCTMPTLNEVQVTLTESDEPADESYYVFKRDDVQQRFGVRLDEGMVNEAGWTQIMRDHLYKHDFAENLVDAAERAWR
ncbi:MAG: hypothetical protein ACLTOP_08365 [Collinsella phocaeensis]